MLDPQTTYIHLDADGNATSTPGGEKFWSLAPNELARFGEGWLISEYSFSSSWTNWEMHPNGDEFVYLLSGAMDMILEENGGTRTVPLRGSGAVIVPRGVWHTAKAHGPCRVLHVTRGGGTAHRPV